MADLFSDPDERALLVHDGAARLNVAPWVVEKDLWVCWLLARLQEIPGLPALTFKGGTSLSKVHRLIQRFSEDIDLTFSRDGWGFEGNRDPLGPNLSNKKRDALVEEVGTKAACVVRDVVIPALIAQCYHNFNDTTCFIHIDKEDPQAVLFGYPRPAATYGYGRPVVKIEFGARGDPWPTEQQVIRPYLEELFEGIAPTAVSTVPTLAAERTFWGKATLLHALYHGTLAKPDKRTDRLSRHLYDLHQIWVDPTVNARLRTAPGLLQAVVRNKMVFFKEGKARYELVDSFILNATPHAELETRLRSDYIAMASMFFPNSTVPSFEQILSSLREIDEMVAMWREG